MSQSHEHDRVDASGAGSDLSDRLQAFVDAWEAGDEPPLADHLPSLVEPEARWQALCELVKVDLEYRWGDRNRPKRLEDFRAEHAELGSREFPADVVFEEFLLRRAAGFEVRPEDYYERFPERVRELRPMFGESDATRVAGRSRAPEGSSVEPAAFVDRLHSAGLLTEDDLERYFGEPDDDVTTLANGLVDGGRLTRLQADRLLRDRPIVLGEYLLVERIGAGGMGEVYHAVHRRMDRDVALKILPDHLVHTAADVARFEREVRAAAQLVHQNILTAYDAGEREGVHFLVTELVDGPNLKSLVVRGRPLTVTEAVDATLQVAAGLAYAHARGIVHRDVKPSNLLIDSTGCVKILDMGLARFDSTEIEETTLTSSGMVMGTVDYMAPEQAMDARRADARADLYSLGCSLFFLLTGRPPYRGATAMQRVVAHREEPIPLLSDRVPDAPARLEAVFSKLLAKSPGKRFQSADELLDAMRGLPQRRIDVAAITGDEPTDEPDPTPTDRDVADPAQRSTYIGTASADAATDGERPDDTVRASRVGGSTREGDGLARNRIAVGLGALLLVLLVAIGVRSFFTPPDDPPTPEPSANRALRFDGRSAHVVVESLDLAEHDAFTVELFATIDRSRPSNLVNWFGRNWFVVYHVNSAWGAGVEGSRPVELLQVDDRAVPGRRTHLAVTWDGREKRIFVDGQPLPSVPNEYDVRPVTSRGLYVGGAPADKLPEWEEDRWFSGLIDELRISSGVRYTEAFEPAERPDADETTIALYHFDEESGDVALDSSGNDHHGRVVGAERVDAREPVGTFPDPVEPPPAAEVDPPPAAASITRDDGWFDVLALHVPKYDSPPGGGEWRQTPDYLESPAAEFARVSFPVVPNDEYRLRVEFERVEGHDAVDVYLPVYTRQVLFVFDGWGGSGLSGLQAVDGKNKPDPRRREGAANTPIENGRRYVAEFRVSAAGEGRVTIGVRLDDWPLMSWTGPVSSLRLIDPKFELSDKRRLGVAAWDSVVRFHRVELMVKDGQSATILRPR